MNQYNVKIVKHNIVQPLHNAILDSATVNGAKTNSETSNSETLKQYNINSEIPNRATLINAILNSAT